MYRWLLTIFTVMIMTCPAFAEQGTIAAKTLTANCSGEPLYFDGIERTSGTLVYTAQWRPNKYNIIYSCGDDQSGTIYQEVEFKKGYQLVDGNECAERSGYRFVEWSCDNEIQNSGTYDVVGDSECTAIWSACQDGEYFDGNACQSCPEGYNHSDGNRDNINTCYKEEKNTGKQIPSDKIPEHCESITSSGICNPGVCTYNDYFGVDDEPCVPDDCIQPIVGVVASINAYVNNDGVSCSLCQDSENGAYPLSNGGNITYAKCYQEMPQTCIQQGCINPDTVGCSAAICADSCSCDDLGTYKKYSDGATEGTPTQECTKSVQALVHNAGYYTATDLSECPLCDPGYTSASDASVGIEVCEKECSVPCSGNDVDSCPDHASCTYDTAYANTGTQYGDNATCIAEDSLCPVKGVTCYDGYTYDENTNTCKALCNTVTLNMNGGNGDTHVLYKYTDDNKWYATKISDTQCSDVVTDLSATPTRQGYVYTGHFNSTLGTINRISSNGVLDGNWLINDNQTIYAQWVAIACECTAGEGAVNCNGIVNENNMCDYTWGCDNGYYSASQSATDAEVAYTAVCSRCPTGFINSDTNATSDTQCYKPCESTCTQGGCPDSVASCSYDITTTNGIQYYGSACSAPEKVCSISDIQCNTGYYKASYVGENANHRYAKGRSYNADICWYDGVSLDCFDRSVIDLLVHEWRVSFEYGDVNGKSVCSTTPGISYSIGNPDENVGGKNCWCKLTSYELDGKKYNATYASWVNISDASWSVSSCSNYCSDACANRVQKSASFRSMLFKGTDLYERCEIEEYNIEYVLNNGIFPVGTKKPETYTVASKTITLPVPTKPGAEFLGWCDNEDLTENCAVNRTVAQGSAGDKIFYAKWNVECETDRWLHVGEDRICLYSHQYTHPAMALKIGDDEYYLNLSENADLPIHENSNTKLRVKHKGQTYNIYDYSVN